MKGKETTSAACLRSHWGFLLLRQPPSSAACPSPHWGSLLLRQPHSFQEHTHFKTRPSAVVPQHFPPISLVAAHHPLPQFSAGCFCRMLERKAGLGLSPTAATRQPSSQTRNVPWVFQVECLTILTSPAQRYWLAEVCLCPWHCVTPDPTPSSTADCHRPHSVCHPPSGHTHPLSPCTRLTLSSRCI